ncbi:MAG TPA: GcrA family cell cycle regulator [Kiloniellales bacterium]|nr:GcrA family cell cycle regulator [Kiloniellales bacterium]
MTWTDERVAELSRLWTSGYSASAIGKILGVSKNAVVGKAHRMRLQSRPSPIRRDQRAPVRRRVPMPARTLGTRPYPVSEPAEPVEAPKPEPAPHLAARRDGRGPNCLWPIGDPGEPDFHFCEAPAVEGKPYCPTHCARAYINRSRADGEAA